MIEYKGNEHAGGGWTAEEKSASGLCRALFITEGSAVCRCGEEETPLEAGGAYILPSALPCSLSVSPAEELVFDRLVFDPLPYAVHGVIRIKSDPLFLSLADVFRQAVSLGDEELAEGLWKLAERFWSGSPAALRLSENLLASIRYMDGLSCEKIETAELAARAGLHPNYYMALFRRQTGLSPYRYAVNRRLRKALGMLRSGAGVTETAAAAGFERLGSFSRAFKNAYGAAPRDHGKIF